MSASFFEKLKKGMGVGEEDESSSSPFAAARAAEEQSEEVKKIKPQRKRGPKPKKVTPPSSFAEVEEVMPKKIGVETPGIKKGEIKEEKVEISFAAGEEDKSSSSPFATAREPSEPAKLSPLPPAQEKWPAVSSEPEGELAIDVYQTENNLIIQTAIAGIKPENLDIAMERDVITVKGIRQKPFEEDGDYFTQECFWGPFSREVILPVEVDPDRAEATMKDGILTIRIPKILREKKRVIKVRI